MQTLRLSIPDSQVKDEAAVVRMHQAIIDKIAAVPGVTVGRARLDGHDDRATAGTIRSTRRIATYTESQIPPLRLFKFVSPGLHEDDGRLAGGRPRLHLDRRVRACGRSPWSRENLARELWGEPSAAHRQARPALPEGRRGAKSSACVSDMRDDGLNKKAPAIGVLAAADEGLLQPETPDARAQSRAA